MRVIEKQKFNNSLETVTCVFSCSNEFIPYLSVALTSLLDNINPNTNYDIVVLGKNIKQQNQTILHKLCSQSNVSLRLIDPDITIDSKTFFTHEHVSGETYFKIFIPQIFANYDKVLVCDADIIIQNDIAKLFNIDISGFPIGASRCYLWNGIINFDVNGMNYTINKLKLKTPEKYMQCGIMLFNIKLLNEQKYTEKLLQNIKGQKFNCMDQDLFNTTFQDFYKELPCRWNYETQQSGFEESINFISPEMKTIYFETAQNPYIIHYSGKEKPWFFPLEEYASLWWKYARLTPFYEEFLNRMSIHNTKRLIKEEKLLKKYKRNYLKYKILKHIVLGKTRERYIKKVNHYKKKIDNAKKILG